MPFSLTDSNLTTLVPPHEILSFFYEISIRGDGNCLFSSLLAALNLPKSLHYQLRRLAVRTNSQVQHFHLNLETEKAKTTYLEKMAQLGTWGTHIEISAIVNALDINVVVVGYDCGKPYAYSSREYYHHTSFYIKHRNEHYTALIPKFAASNLESARTKAVSLLNFEPNLKLTHTRQPTTKSATKAAH